MKRAKAVQIRLSGVLLLSCWSCLETIAQEGWMPVGPPTITNKVIQTVGGITYFTHTSMVETGYRVAPGLVSRSGTHLTHIINEEQWTGYSIPEHWFTGETHVSVLGALPPGEYLLQLCSTAPYAFPHPFSWSSFTVPASDAVTLQTWAETNRAHLAVAGIPKVKYVVEAASPSTSWTPLATNVGGPFTWSEAIRPEEQPRFYRVQIIGQ